MQSAWHALSSHYFWTGTFLKHLNKKKNSIRITVDFACFYSEAQRKEYDQAFEDLKNSVKSKKFADIRSTAAATIDLVENQSKTSSNTKENICAVIRLFYSDGFLMSLEEIWSFWIIIGRSYFSLFLFFLQYYVKKCLLWINNKVLLWPFFSYFQYKKWTNHVFYWNFSFILSILLQITHTKEKWRKMKLLNSFSLVRII